MADNASAAIVHPKSYTSIQNDNTMLRPDALPNTVITISYSKVALLGASLPSLSGDGAYVLQQDNSPQAMTGKQAPTRRHRCTIHLFVLRYS